MSGSWLWQGLVLTVLGAVITGDSGGGGGMLPNEVPPTRTPVTPAQMFAAFQAAWPSIIGDTPSRTALLVLLAHWSLETANGKAMIQWNVGNFKAPRMGADGVPFCRYETTEVENGVTVSVVQPFVAYLSLDAGVRAYLRAMHGRFGAAWQYVEAGDIPGFAQALKDQHYYTASEASYEHVLQARYDALSSQIA